MTKQLTLPFNISSIRSPSPIERPQVLIIGIFGSKKDMNETYLNDKILTPILGELGRIPDKILIPVDNSAMSLYIEDWAHSLNIPIQSFEADFRNRGRSAVIFRDSRIERECSIAIVFQAPRTTRYDLLAQRMVHKGKRVFFIKTTFDIEELII